MKALSNAGYHIGRIGYPSCSKFSYNASLDSLKGSRDSLNNSYENESDKSFDGPVLKLDSKHRESPSKSIQIPQAIAEEDENSITISTMNLIRGRQSQMIFSVKEFKKVTNVFK